MTRETANRLRRKYHHSYDYFSVPNEINSYWAGFIAADGCIREGSMLQVKLAPVDREHLEKLKNALQWSGNIEQQKSKASKNGRIKEYPCIRINGAQKIVDDLRVNYNIVERKSLILRPPPLKHEAHILAFICGYLDGDGCISVKKRVKRPSYTGLAITLLGTNEMLAWIKQHVAPYSESQIRKKGNIYRIDFYENVAKRVGELLLTVTVPRLPRKWDRLKMAKPKSKVFDPDYSPYGSPPAGVKGTPDQWAAHFKARFTEAEIKEYLGDDNPWQVLGIAVGSDAAAIKSAYRKRARESHPDLNPGKSQSEFIKIQAAYEFLIKGRL